MNVSRMTGILALVVVFALAGSASARDSEAHQSHEPRGYMGVTLSIVTNVDEGKDDNGVYINDVMEGSPAKAAGLAAQDRVVAIDGVAVSDFGSLRDAMALMRPDQTISVTLEREGAEQTISVTLGERPVSDESRWAVVVDENRPYFGVHIEELNSQLAEYFGVDGGILITKVLEDSPASRAGLQAGDIAVAVEGERVIDQDSLHRAMTDVEPGDEVAVRVEHRGSPRTVYVEVGSHADHNTMIDVRELHEMLNVGGDGNVEFVLPHGDGRSWTIHREHDRDSQEVTEGDDSSGAPRRPGSPGSPGRPACRSGCRRPAPGRPRRRPRPCRRGC